ncbi:MAG: FliI/YscN family ATPase, partial [Desulfuromonadaceae bacterium]|nr:FliI/YscN family ATPase [Desulfuromonadaceae bacterium]
INGLLTCGTGQRMGIMAGSGVGKSVLLGMLAKHTRADVNVIALIGERGREVREFIERDLGPEGLARSVVVTATSDVSPLLRMRGAFVATTIAEYFCAQGKNVLLLMDSVTRFAMAMREVGLAIGEPPTTKGYTPSVFATLPKLLERAGNFTGKGSITGLYTVLVEGDDMNEPVADAVRSILDGHIVLSRDLAARNHYPSIDILNSASRVMRDIVAPEHLQLNGQIREVMAMHKEAEDLINIGAYVEGSNSKIDYAISRIEAIREFLCQGMDEAVDLEQTLAELTTLILDRRQQAR